MSWLACLLCSRMACCCFIRARYWGTPSLPVGVAHETMDVVAHVVVEVLELPWRSLMVLLEPSICILLRLSAASMGRGCSG